MKGEYFSKMRTQEKIKSFASNAYNLGKDVLYKFINGSEIKNQENFNIAEPNSNDLKLIEFQKEVIDLIKVINVMRKVVQTSVLEMKTVGLLMPESGQASFKYGNIMNEFEVILFVEFRIYVNISLAVMKLYREEIRLGWKLIS